MYIKKMHLKTETDQSNSFEITSRSGGL